jgi:hypothetical protein
MNWNGFGRKRSWSNLDAVLVFAWRDWGTTRKTSVMMVDVPAEVRKEDIPNKSRELVTAAPSVTCPRSISCPKT